MREYGTAAADVIIGTADSDSITGFAGNDSVHSGDGNDLDSGGKGNDVIGGGNGDDTVYGASGDDSMGGDDGNDLLAGGVGNDHAWGGSGNDLVVGGPGDDSLYGYTGDDFIVGGSGNDHIETGSGMDYAAGGVGDDDITGGDGYDTLDSIFDLVDPTLGANILAGDGNDHIHMAEAHIMARGGAGDDTFDGRAFGAFLDGGDGNDHFELQNWTQTNVDVVGGNGTDTFTVGPARNLGGESVLTIEDFGNEDRLHFGFVTKPVDEIDLNHDGLLDMGDLGTSPDRTHEFIEGESGRLHLDVAAIMAEGGDNHEQSVIFWTNPSVDFDQIV